MLLPARQRARRLAASLGQPGQQLVDAGKRAGPAGPALAGDGTGTFVYPMDIAWARDRRLLVADAGANLLRTVDEQGVVGTVTTSAPLKTPHGVAVGPDGTIFVADMGTHRVLALDAAGTVPTVGG